MPGLLEHPTPTQALPAVGLFRPLRGAGSRPMSTKNGAATTSVLSFVSPIKFMVAPIAAAQAPAKAAGSRAGTGGSSRRQDHAEPPGEELLPRGHFLAQLYREKRRADRSKAPLSLVIYRLADARHADDAATLIELVLGNKRETDIVGRLADGVIAVICTDTGDAGAHRFIEKIDALSDDLPYSVECATYPDQLFEGLADSPAAVHGPSPLLPAHREPTRDSYLLKRPLDIIGALIALVLFSPLMLVTALAVKLSSPGPIIFRQTRLGRSGVPFVFYKFRSMVAGNNDQIHRDYVKSLIEGENGKVNQADESEPMFKIKADPRVTWVGRIIRKTSIDELPQLFNVLKGDMSLVGPRPPVPYEAENYQSWHLRRVLDIKPGITGLWQVEGRSKVTFDEMVRMDLRYIRSCSLSLDLRILAKTVLVVLRTDGAA